MALYAGERLVAGQFGVRLGAHFHPWIAAMDPDLKAYSPGSLFQWMAIEAMPRLGLNIYELGAQGDHWKNMFALDALPIRAGTITGAAGRLTTAGERMYEQPAQKMESLARLRRRLDHIAASELTLTGRTRGVIDALIGLERRNAARNPG
jgi:CelD/BcsL family acetyltransferase involved in cellulose biosynthesis